MTVVVAIIIVALFIGIFRLFKIVPIAAEVLTMTRRVTAVILDSALDDDAKERAVRDASKRLIIQFLQITIRAAAALAVPTVVLYGVDWVGLASLEDIVAFLLRWEVILISTLAVVLISLVWR